MSIHREKELKKQLDAFFNDRFGISDFYDKLTCDDFIELKKILSCINNVITLLTTKQCAYQLLADKRISKKEYQEIINHIESQHANTNGFDIQYNFPTKREAVGILAEVKCNIPVNKTSFGAAQIDGLKEDAKHLLQGKSKAQIQVKNYYKFLVVLAANEHIKECTTKVFKNQINIQEYRTNTILSTENVYIMYLSIGK